MTHRNSILSGLAMILICSPAWAQQTPPASEQNDLFANIALYSPEPKRGGIEEVLPPKLPDIQLEARVSDSAIPSPAYHVMTSREEFKTELEKLKKQYAPFLEDRTPKIESTRARLDLTAFQFRVEQPDDLKDFGRVLAGQGQWEQVKIPHYRGPRDWWSGYYRLELAIPDSAWAFPCQVLHFNAVSDFCEVYINGRYVGGHTGWWSPFEIDVTDYLNRTGKNILIVKVRNETSWEYNRSGVKIFSCTAPGWDDPIDGWHESQSGCGIWQKCWLEGRPDIHVTDIFVRPDINNKTIETRVKIYQHAIRDQKVKLTASIFPRNFDGKPIENILINKAQTVGPHYSEIITHLKFENFRLWDLDTPYLYTMQINVDPIEGLPAADRCRADFGMRSFTMDETQSPKGTLYLNGREIILRGANHMGNLHRPIMEGKPEQVIEDILIAKMAHMNYWRLTQCPVQPEVYDLCDRLGIFAQTDLPLFGGLQKESLTEAIKQVGEMTLLVRNHPCNDMITFINEPSAGVNGKEFLILDRDQLERFFVAAAELAHNLNPDQIIKPVDGDYDPPTFGLPDNHCYCLWYDSHAVPYGKLNKGYWVKIKPGWKFGCGEYGAEGLDNPETMLKYCPADWMPKSLDEPWNPDKIASSQTWNQHSSWFDTQNTMRTWVEASQSHQAFAIRTMTRAFRRQKDMVSSAVHLLIDAWPVGWMKTLVDVDRLPKKSYFEFRDALTPLMVDIRTDRTRYYAGQPLSVEFWVCNDQAAPFAEGTLVWEVWQNDQRIFAQSKSAAIPSCDPAFVGKFPFACPDVKTRTPLKIRLALLDSQKNTVHASEQMVEVFPAFNKAANQSRIAEIVGAADGRAWRFAQSLGLKPEPFATGDNAVKIIFVDDPESLAAVSDAVLQTVNNGATALLLDQPAKKTWVLGQNKIEVKSLACGKEFITRQTGHPFVAEFKPFDFAYWYDPREDRINYAVENFLVGDNLKSILLTRDGKDKIPFVAELPAGKGSFIIEQLVYDYHIGHNPIADRFFQIILDHAVSP